MNETILGNTRIAQGKIILNLAISLDGFIATEDGGFDWIGGDDDKRLDTVNKMDFQDFLSNIDVVVMGKRCFEQNFAKDYSTKKVYVATHEKMLDFNNIHFVAEDLIEKIMQEKADGKNIFLFGGGVLIEPFIKNDLIDEYRIGIIPIILGKGRPLFLNAGTKIPLHLDEYSVGEGIVCMHYSKRAKA